MTWLAYLFSIYGLSWACVGLFRWYALDKGMLDQPNGRSSHLSATPRGGGVVFFLGWFALVGIFYFLKWLTYDIVQCFYPAFLVGFIGFWDDKNGLSASTRFIFQSIAAITFLFLIHEGGMIILPWFNLPLPLCFLMLVIGIVWMTNLYNFMDGSDGMAAQEAMFFFGVGGTLLLQQDAIHLGLLAWGLVAMLGGFLTWNWPTARIFMGDSGSCFLGFMMAAFAIIANKYYNISFTLWAVLTGLFWFDASITLLRRIIKRDKWRQPHRLHAYQRLIQHGWTHRQVLLGAIGVNAVLSGLVYVAYRDPRLEMFSLSVAIAFLTCLYLMVEIAKPMYGAWYEAK